MSGPGTISFWWRVSSELDFDWLRFRIDGVLQAEQMDGRMGEHYYGQERREGAEQKAERLVREGPKKARWTEGDLRLRRKADAVKIRLAVELRWETTMTLKWISERLQMAAWTHLNRRLYDHRKKSGKG